MISDRSVLAVITARGGSKGVPGKNVRMVAGKPLLGWTIDAARRSRYIDRLVLSTDDPQIMALATTLGCEAPFQRSAALATDAASSIDVVLDAIERCPGHDYVVLLQPTSPLRTAEDIDGALEQCQARSAPACVSVCQATQSPYWMFTLDGGVLAALLPQRTATRRQDLPAAYVLNGAVYVAQIEWLRESRAFIGAQTIAYEMPVERSVDIDNEFELRIAELRLSAHA
jgi:CMP-N,N'-diacetyllegionaminic acid synthase